MMSLFERTHLRINKSSPLSNERGMAMIETIPILVIFIIFIAYGLGFFGVVHTGILNSISARAYTFETFRNRANVVYFRDKSADVFFHYQGAGNRVHGIDSETRPPGATNAQFATTRPLAIGRRVPASGALQSDHNEEIFSIPGRNRRGGVESSPAWVMVAYGICIDARCGE